MSTLLSGQQRTQNFISGNNVDHPPFHPIIMRWAAQYAGVNYRDFCCHPLSKCQAMIKCANDFNIDWVTVMSDPYAEAEAFGIKVEYPENDLPHNLNHFSSVDELIRLKPYDPTQNHRTKARITEISTYRELIGNRYFVVGWVEGPIGEYVDLRCANEASLDFIDEPEKVGLAMDIITDAAKHFITEQINAGADCIGIGDAFASQIGPALYRKFAFPREKLLVDHIHSLGAKAMLHVCGNTTAIIPDMIATGVDIIDIDHLVLSLAPFSSLLAPHQVFSGKLDPIGDLQNGSSEQIYCAIRKAQAETNNRIILSAGCEVTPGTSVEKMRIFQQLVQRLNL